jgi:single-strand DNA-binding protein
MSKLTNQAQLIGRLGKDAEVFTFDDGTNKCRAVLSTNEEYVGLDGATIRRTVWHDIVAWGDLALVLGGLKKGQKLIVQGRISYRSYEDGEGHCRYITEIVASELLIITNDE